MSKDFEESRNDIPPEEGPGELARQFQMFLDHQKDMSDEEKQLTLAICISGHTDKGVENHNGDPTQMNMCSMIGGPPPSIAAAILVIIEKLIETSPEFLGFFLIGLIKKQHELARAASMPDIDSAENIEDALKKIFDANTTKH